MVVEEERASYVKEYVQSLAGPTNKDENRLQEVLEDTMIQSLFELEKRFKAYKDRLSYEESPEKIKATVARMERRFSTRFHNEDMYEKKSQIRHIHREALKNCYVMLTNDLDLFKSSLMDDLLASDVVSESDQESIRGHGTRKRQNEEFYAYLVGRLTFEEFHNTFLPALSKDHPHLADALIAELDRLEDEYQDLQCVACRARKHIQLKRLATPLLMLKVIDLPMFTDLRGSGLSNNSKWTDLRQTVSDADIINAMEKKYPDFYQEFQQQQCSSLECRCPAQDVPDTADAGIALDRSTSIQESSSGFETCLSGTTDVDDVDGEVGGMLSFQMEDLEQEYKMSAYPRGLCLIINNTYFRNTHYGNRYGSDVDVYKLTATFKRLQFNVIFEKDLSSRKIKAVLEDYSHKDHSNYDAFVCVILSHGDQEGILGCDAVRVKVADLTSMFKATKCPSLAGKPKIFFLQTSRGDAWMDGHKLDENSAEDIADESDFLIGYSAVEGYASFRNARSGSHFINALTKVLDSQADQHDLLDCLTMTNREVSRLAMRVRTEYVAGRKQVPAPVFTLTKRIHFTSDPLWPHSADGSES